MSDGTLERTVAEIPTEIWRGGPSAITQEIERLLSRTTDRTEELETPKTPDIGPASVLVPTANGFEIDPKSPSTTERSNPTQLALHAQIVKNLVELSDIVGGSNTHHSLAAEFNNYANLVNVELSELDVPAAWASGIALDEFVRALENPRQGTVTDPLEPETVAQLYALMRHHTAFIHGFALGVELTARSQAIHQANRSHEEIRRTTLDALRPMLSTKRLLAQRAHNLIASLVRAFEELDTRAITLLSSGSETAKNSLISFGRAVHPVVVIAEGSTLIGVVMNLPHPEILKTALVYLHENAAVITAFAASDPELSRWIVWLIAKTRQFLKEFGDQI
jgi:hypothetical protein